MKAAQGHLWCLVGLMLLSRVCLTFGSRTRSAAFLYASATSLTRLPRHLCVVSAAGTSEVDKSRAVRVSTYNVLSTSLSTPSNMPFNDPADLDPDNRYKLVIERLEGEVERNGIICLQEVSRLWAGQLHVYFSKRGYHFVTSLYGHYKNGYMGVGLAWPTSLYEVEAVDIHRLGDDMAQPAKKAKPHLLERIVGFGSKILQAVGLGKPKGKDKGMAWQAAKDRKNAMIYAKFRQTSSDARFGVATYHMPCMFYMPEAMVIHSALAVQRTQLLAGETPHILCGDFNFRPESSQYKLVTTGAIDEDHPNYPIVPPTSSQDGSDSVPWTPNTRIPLKSAYLEHQGEEPEFTNFAQMRDEPFMGTLDYIFLSPGWRVVDTHRTPTLQEVGERPLPAGKEPSDHLFIAADVVIPTGEEAVAAATTTKSPP